MNCFYFREYQEYDEQFLELEGGQVGAVEALIHSYPDFLRIEALTLEDTDEEGDLDLEGALNLVTALWEKKIIMTREPLEANPFE